MAKSRYTTIHQHAPLRTPPEWGSQEKQLIVQLEELFDDVYRRFGRLRLQDLGDPLAQTITDTSEGVDQAAKDIVVVGENAAYLERDLVELAETVSRLERELAYKADQSDLLDYVRNGDLKELVLDILDGEPIPRLSVTELTVAELECPEGIIRAKAIELVDKPVATEEWVEEQLKDVLARLETLEKA